MGRFAASGYLSPYSASARRLQSSADGGCFTTTRQGPASLKFPDAVSATGKYCCQRGCGIEQYMAAANPKSGDPLGRHQGSSGHG